jgi:hypothetical protein
VVLAAVLGVSLTACSSVPTTSPDVARSGAIESRGGPARDDHGHGRSRTAVFTAACDITGALDAFRTALGTLNPNQVGSLTGGRREINWDGVPAAFTNSDAFPADFFNQPTTGRARGVVFSTRGTGFRVSDNNFADVNPSYADQFEFFSPVRTFQAVGDNVTSVEFFVPGSNTPATSTGFGVVFSDLDHHGSGRIRLFDSRGRNLGTYLAPPCPGGISFVGVKFPESIVARVDILAGKDALGVESFDLTSRVRGRDLDHRNRGRARDLAIMDDFIYGEPIAR